MEGESPDPVCSVVIRAFNEERHIGRLLSGLMAQRGVDLDLILVDSGSTDATVSIASRFPVRILRIEPDAFSFGSSLNLGCDEARGDYIVIASAHVYPLYTDWIAHLVSGLRDARCALVYGKQRGTHASKFSERQIFRTWFPDESVQEQPHAFCNNANAAIKSSIWQEFQYDPLLPGLEDIDWARRVMSAGYKIAYCAEAEIIHIHDETYREIFNRYRREAIAMKTIYPEERHFTLIDLARLFITNVLSDVIAAFRQRVLLKEFVGIVRFRAMQFGGSYRGFRSTRVTSQLRRKLYYPPSFGEDESTFDPNREAVDYEQS